MERTRSIPTEMQRVRMLIREAAIDQEKRTVRVVFSTDEPVDRGSYTEILSHEPGAMDTTRVEAGAAVLWNHNWDNHIGITQDIDIDHESGLARATLRFSRKAFAEEVFQDIQDGILTHVSVGYFIEQETEARDKNGHTTYTATRWTPHEISVVHTPADLGAQIGRNAEQQPQKQTTDTEVIDMPTENTNENVNTAIEAERARCASIQNLGQKLGVAPDRIAEAQRSGESLSEFADKAEAVKPPQATRSNAEEAGITDNDLEKFSISRAMTASITGNWKKAGLERAVSMALADQRGKEARDGGLIIPHEAFIRQMSTRNQVSDSAPLITDARRADLFIDLLREQSLLGRLNMTMHSGLAGNGSISMPRQTGDAACKWVGEHGTADNSKVPTDLVTIKPGTLVCAVPVSRRLRLTSYANLDAIIQNSMVKSMGRELDKTTIYGAADDKQNQPQGIMNRTIQEAELSNVNTPTWEELLGMEELLLDESASGNNILLINNKMRTHLKSKVKTGNTALFLMGDDNRTMGYETIATNIMKYATGATPVNDMLLMNPEYAVWGFWSDLDVIFQHKEEDDSYIIRMFQDAGFALEHDEAFVKTKKKA
ncbi:phage major capsid protein [Shewanella submarina]|uniref:Phage major capsid protein n=1 Tax=Shewanella submarina TaxID=2016376 RepID=A0ABV7G843_9GAMM|nr:phage major capsid protein [Shewanella submarina]MCL1038341.1 phage major capsid protein [Shewanella submarina]